MCKCTSGSETSPNFRRLRTTTVSGRTSRLTIASTPLSLPTAAHTRRSSTFEPPPFDDNFLAAVHAAPEVYDQDFHFALMGSFGTHVLSSAQMGSKYGEESHFTRDQYNKMTATNRNWSIMARASFIVSVKTSIAHGADIVSTKHFEKFSTDTLKYSLGATPANWDPEDWLSAALTRKPVPSLMKLKPLSEVFTALNFPNQSSATKLKTMRRQTLKLP
ncbi:unnamed protein product [Prorocentrum cordatum]|uniref:MACPF domain-containing protein n=1 Tax=Prorocentrum cordatum TaxID=2364126 RepID=A0ABN9WQB9_9DINO|nr:unnamed protein product [Polarella glacialis]